MKIQFASLMLMLLSVVCLGQGTKAHEPTIGKNLGDDFAKAAMRAVLAMDIDDESPDVRQVVKSLVREANVNAVSIEEMKSLQDLGSLQRVWLLNWNTTGVKWTASEADLANKRDRTCQASMIASLRARTYKPLPLICVAQ